MKLRRVLGTLVATAFFATMIHPLPALAAAPVLDVITVDPIHTSVGKTGLAHLDATTFDPIGGTNPGTDSSATNHIVRTNDVINYDFQFNVNAADATNVVITSTLGQNAGADVADWVAVPSGCGGGSSISGDGQTLICNIGAVTQGSVQDIVPSAKMRTSAPNGATIEPSVTVSDTADGATPVTATGYFDGQGTPSVEGVQDTITGTAKYNAMKQGTLAKPVTEPFTYFGDNNVQGYYVDYPILVREGDGLPTSTGSAAVGITTAPASIVIMDSVANNAALAMTNACGVNGSGITLPNQPYGKIGVVGGATSSNSVIDSGTITCTQAGGPGTAVTITIANAVSTGATYPTNHVGGAGVDNATYVISGYLRMWVNDTGGNLAGGGTPVSDTYTGIDPGEPDELPANLTATVTLTAQGPAGAHGALSKSFVQNTSGTAITPTNAQGPALSSNMHLVSSINLANTATVTQGSADLQNVLICDTIDTTNIAVSPFTGDAAGAVDSLYGGAVHIASNGFFTDATPPAGFQVQYGDSTSASDCTGATGFHPNWNDATAVRVKITFTQLTAATSQQLKIYLSETVANGLSAGTLVNNNVAAIATSSAGGAGLSISTSTKGQIFTTAITATKYMFATTAGASVFNANGTHPTGASGNSSGNAGMVDTNQQVVAAIDADGTQGTLPSPSTVECEIIPANLSAHDFDGTTGTASGSPVSMAKEAGTTPASIVIEYSIVPTFGGDQCTDAGGGWTTTPPTPRTSITRIRATYDLPANTLERMFVNLQVASAVAVNTVITNTSVTTVGGANPQTKTAQVIIEPETVRAQKTPASQTVAAGSNATFTLSGTVQGAGTPTSGTITIVDTLPVGMMYNSGSASLAEGGAGGTYQIGTASATPTSVTIVGSNQVITWTLGKVTSSPGVFIQLPSITFTASTDLSQSGTVTNSATIADTLDGSPGAAGHTATANVTITNTAAFHILKTTSTPTIPVAGTISWGLVYANTAGTNAASTDFIDELPYNGDSRGSSFHGTLSLATVGDAVDTGGSHFTITVTYTKATHGQINDDPSCTSNGGAITSGCASVPLTVWCPSLSGGTCPANLSEVTGVRMQGGTLNAGALTRTITMTATTAANVFTDIYWNLFGGRTDFLTLPVHSPKVQTVVPTPPIPFVTLVKSCIAPANCITAPQQPYYGQAPAPDVTYQLTATNTGGHDAGSLVITDPMPPNMDFKVGSASGTFPGLTVTVTYSSDGTTFSYAPVSAGGGAFAGYDRNVKSIRWTLSGNLTGTAPNNTGTVQFTAVIQ